MEHSFELKNKSELSDNNIECTNKMCIKTNKNFTYKIRDQAKRLYDLQAYKILCEKLISKLNPSINLPVKECAINQIPNNNNNNHSVVNSIVFENTKTESKVLLLKLNKIENDYKQLEDKYNNLNNLYVKMKESYYKPCSFFSKPLSFEKKIQDNSEFDKSNVDYYNNNIDQIKNPKDVENTNALEYYKDLYKLFINLLNERTRISKQFKDEIKLNEEQKVYIEVLKQVINSSLIKNGLKELKSKTKFDDIIEISLLREQNANLDSSINIIKKEKEDLNIEIINLSKYSKELENKIKELKLETNVKRNESLKQNDYIEDLKKQLDEAKNTNNSNLKTIQDKDYQINKLNINIKQKDISINGLISDINLMLEKEQSLNKKCNEIEERATNQENKQKDQFLNQINENNNLIKNITDNFEKEIVNLSKKIKHLCDENLVLKQEVNRYKESYENISKEMNLIVSTSKDNNIMLINEIKKSRSDFVNENNNANNQIESLLNEININKDELNEYKNKYFLLRSNYESIINKNISLNNDIEVLNIKLNELIVKNNNYINEIKVLREEKLSLETELQREFNYFDQNKFKYENNENLINLHNYNNKDNLNYNYSNTCNNYLKEASINIPLMSSSIRIKNDEDLNQIDNSSNFVNIKNVLNDIKSSIYYCKDVSNKCIGNFTDNFCCKNAEYKITDKNENLKNETKYMRDELEKCCNLIEKISKDLNYNKDFKLKTDVSSNTKTYNNLNDQNTLDTENYILIINKLTDENSNLKKNIKKNFEDKVILNDQEIIILKETKSLLHELLLKAINYDKEICDIINCSIQIIKEIHTDRIKEKFLLEEINKLDINSKYNDINYINNNKIQLNNDLDKLLCRIKLNSSELNNYILAYDSMIGNNTKY